MPEPRSQSPTDEHFSTLHICLSVFSAWFRGLPHPAELMVTRLHPWLLWRKSGEGPNSRERDRAQTENGGNSIVSNAEGFDWQVKGVGALVLVPESQEFTCCLWSL